MRLRVRPVGSKSITRLDVEPQCTLEQLQRTVAAAVAPQTSPSDLFFSLNKQDKLQGTAATTLSALGLATLSDSGLHLCTQDPTDRAALLPTAFGPGGLIKLHYQLRDRCLQLLEPRDLASVSCVCAELHLAAASNALWEPHIAATFPDHQMDSDGHHMSAKSMYGQLVVRKRQFEAERREAMRRARAAHRPWPHHGGASPLLQPPLPGFVPGIVGRDYDRLPFLTGGPGMAPMGGGLMRPAGGMFGTSLGGARRAAGNWRLH
ncbi:hypothetical protein WJX73_002995 [Symbiochloris irregularis]|uniref:Ubiquitin-like domain-containing protein n=1 Tax=Symbiochloris irregularis TaxID=706552 RepID=A0AAW1PR69_9CHLO